MRGRVKSATNSVGTPDWLWGALAAEFGPLYDPCPFNPKFDPKVDQCGLKADWGALTYVNPPFSKAKAVA